ncbi:MAG TPA: YIP1 family protein [Thermoanaerobaculia bacterium]|nr:YIP1 family protein [Thermoanaerobaculia bacterium]
MEENSLGRLAGALISPVKTFRSIGERPTWVVALLVLALVLGSVSYVVSLRTDWEDIIRQSVRESGRDVPAQALEQQISITKKIGPYLAIAGGLIFLPGGFALFALVLWVTFKLLGSELDYRRSFATTLHAMMPLALGQLLSLPAVLSRATIGYQDIKAGSFLPTNLALLAPDGTSHAVMALLASLDLFSLWVVVLLIVGFHLVARVSKAAAAGGVLVLWALFILIKVGWASLFG